MNNERIRFLVELIGEVARTAFRIADDSEERDEEGSRIHVVGSGDFDALSKALDACNEVPELGDEYVRDGWLRALDELRGLLDAAPTVQCNTCSGTGDMHEPGQEPGSCARCKGTGRIPADHHHGEPSHWANLAGQTITADLKAYNLKSGGAPAAACAAYSIPLYRQQAAQPQGEPVAWRVTGRGGLTVTPEYPKWATGKCSEGLKVEALVVADKPKSAPVIAGSVLDSYDYAIADLDPESACIYVSNGELAQLVAAVRTLQARYLTPPEPEAALCGFYQVTGYPSLVRELVGHVAQLQESAKRNVKPWEDTFPPTLLPAYVERVKTANAALQPPAEPILVEAVAVTRMCPQDGLWLDWLVEGGIAALELPGTLLLVAQGTLTDDSGNGYVFPARNPEDDA